MRCGSAGVSCPWHQHLYQGHSQSSEVHRAFTLASDWAEKNGRAAQGSGSMLAAVRALVEAEHRSAVLADTLAVAERLARGDGEGLLQRIVSHFQHLFAVPSIEGVVTAINQVLPDVAGMLACMI